jgi:hypothetical protein
MKIVSFILFLFPLSLLITSTTTNNQGYIEKNRYRVFIVQDTLRKEVLLNEQVILLNKKPFVIELHLKNENEGVSLNASYRTNFYNTPLNRRFKDWSSISAKTMSESMMNEDKDLLLSNENVCFWYYDSKDKHRMDPTIQKTDTSIITTQTVAYLNDSDEENPKDYPIKKVKGPIYIVFFNYDYLEDYTHKKEDAYKVYNEIDRKKVKLIFK